MATGVPLPSSPLRPGRIWRLPPPDLARRAADAQRTMTAAEDRVRADKRRAGVRTEAEAEPDPSGLLGNELTPLVTTLGSLEAKRLATNPLWARVLTERLAGVGIGRGDVVAASFSGSFPGLNLAVMAACQALGADLTAVSSTTASTWGANQPGFTWPEIEARLVGAGLVARASWAVTAGGEADGALDLPVEGRTAARAAMQAAARRLGVPALEPRDFDDAVRQRIALYRRAANGRPVALYVNVGGASASLGRSPAILRQRSGFLPGGPFDLSPGRGVTARFAEQGVRVLMLLNVRDLALRWGVPLSGRRR
jgi:poly-gamma-glutamate system protein